LCLFPDGEAANHLEIPGLVIYTNDMNMPHDIGVRIKTLRREKGLSQDELANQVGVSRSAVAQWETGRTGQVTGNLSRIAGALDASVEFLVYGNDKTGPAAISQGDELAMLRLYRECGPEDRQMLLRMARRLVKS
jgi:transcriptional regulator with XRE-family HTH domain